MRAGLKLTGATALAAVVSGTAIGTVSAAVFVPRSTDSPKAVQVEQANRRAFIPGYTDFPNALRLAQPKQEFIPGYTDFPNFLRLSDSRATHVKAVVAPPAAEPSSSAGFGWSDAGIGFAVTLSVVLGAVGVANAARRYRVQAQV
jgi:hypothetical protein